jgi:hypothetical protein
MPVAGKRPCCICIAGSILKVELAPDSRLVVGPRARPCGVAVSRRRERGIRITLRVAAFRREWQLTRRRNRRVCRLH